MPTSEFPGDLIALHNGTVLRVHSAALCAGRICCIHNQTDHLMKTWPQHWRQDRGIMERLCPCGIGHPDPDDEAIRSGIDSGVHGCCDHHYSEGRV